MKQLLFLLCIFLVSNTSAQHSEEELIESINKSLTALENYDYAAFKELVNIDINQFIKEIKKELPADQLKFFDPASIRMQLSDLEITQYLDNLDERVDPSIVWDGLAVKEVTDVTRETENLPAGKQNYSFRIKAILKSNDPAITYKTLVLINYWGNELADINFVTITPVKIGKRQPSNSNPPKVEVNVIDLDQEMEDENLTMKTETYEGTINEENARVDLIFELKFGLTFYNSCRFKFEKNEGLEEIRHLKGHPIHTFYNEASKETYYFKLYHEMLYGIVQNKKGIITGHILMPQTN